MSAIRSPSSSASASSSSSSARSSSSIRKSAIRAVGRSAAKSGGESHELIEVRPRLVELAGVATKPRDLRAGFEHDGAYGIRQRYVGERRDAPGDRAETLDAHALLGGEGVQRSDKRGIAEIAGPQRAPRRRRRLARLRRSAARRRATRDRPGVPTSCSHATTSRISRGAEESGAPVQLHRKPKRRSAAANSGAFERLRMSTAIFLGDTPLATRSCAVLATASASRCNASIAGEELRADRDRGRFAAMCAQLVMQLRLEQRSRGQALWCATSRIR